MCFRKRVSVVTLGLKKRLNMEDKYKYRIKDKYKSKYKYDETECGRDFNAWVVEN